MPDLPSLPHRSVPGSPVTAPSLPPVAFSCSRTAEREVSVRLTLSGELDLAAQSDFRQALDDALAESDRVLLDLSALTLIDCAGLFVLFAAAERCRREVATLTLHSPRGQVRRMLDLVGPPDGVAISDQSDHLLCDEAAVAA